MSSKRLIMLTGCSRGLGRALVDEFIGAGHTVMGCSRSDAGMQELRELYGTPHEFAALDVSDDAAVKAWSAKCFKQYGAPDLLVNNAGVINEPANLVDVSDVEFRQVLAVNVSGVANMIRHVVPAMIDTQKNGIVINLSSGWGRSVSSGVAPYCASKWAIEGLTKALAEELPSGMAAVPLSPGVIDTDMLRSCWGDDAGAYQEPADWARQAAPYILSLSAKHNGQSLTTPG